MAVKRAKDHPLTVIFSPYREPPTRRMKLFLEEACRYSRSWRMLKVQAVRVRELIGLAEAATPLLEVCEVHGSVEQDMDINLV